MKNAFDAGELILEYPLYPSHGEGHRTAPTARHAIIRCLSVWCQAAGAHRTGPIVGQRMEDVRDIVRLATRG